MHNSYQAIMYSSSVRRHAQSPRVSLSRLCALLPADGGGSSAVDHGIMLVLGNGKRTKPRRKRGKSVLFAQELTDEHLITPAVTSADKQVPGEI